MAAAYGEGFVMSSQFYLVVAGEGFAEGFDSGDSDNGAAVDSPELIGV